MVTEAPSLDAHTSFLYEAAALRAVEKLYQRHHEKSPEFQDLIRREIGLVCREYAPLISSPTEVEYITSLCTEYLLSPRLPLFGTPVSDLQLPALAAQSIAHAGIKTLRELVQKSKEDLFAQKNFGRRSIIDVNKALTKISPYLKLGMQFY